MLDRRLRQQGARSVYYFVLDATSTVSFSTCDGTCIDTVLYVRDVCNDNGSQLPCDDDSCARAILPAHGKSGAEPRQRDAGTGAHYLVLDTFSASPGPCGAFTITPTGGPEARFRVFPVGVGVGVGDPIEPIGSCLPATGRGRRRRRRRGRHGNAPQGTPVGVIVKAPQGPGDAEKVSSTRLVRAGSSVALTRLCTGFPVGRQDSPARHESSSQGSCEPLSLHTSRT